MSDRDHEPLPDDLALFFDAERARPEAGAAPRRRVAARLSAALGPALLGAAGATASGTAASGAAAATAGGAAAGATAGAAAGMAAGAGVGSSAVGAAGAAGAGASLAPVAGGAGLFGALFAKPLALGLTVAALGAGAAGVYTVGTSDPPVEETSPVASAAIAPAAQATTASVIGAAPAREPEALPPSEEAPALAPAVTAQPEALPPQAAPSAAPNTNPSASASARARGEEADAKPGRDVDLAAERALLEEARAAIVRGQGTSALSALDRHAKEHPRGRLTEEREALRVQALAAAGRRDEARARAEQFKKSFPKSLALPALEQAVGPL